MLKGALRWIAVCSFAAVMWIGALYGVRSLFQFFN